MGLYGKGTSHLGNPLPPVVGSVLCFPKDCRALAADPGPGWVTLLGQEGASRGVLGETMQVIIPAEFFPMGDCPVQLLINHFVP